MAKKQTFAIAILETHSYTYHAIGRDEEHAIKVMKSVMRKRCAIERDHVKKSNEKYGSHHNWTTFKELWDAWGDAINVFEGASIGSGFLDYDLLVEGK